MYPHTEIYSSIDDTFINIETHTNNHCTLQCSARVAGVAAATTASLRQSITKRIFIAESKYETHKCKTIKYINNLLSRFNL